MSQAKPYQNQFSWALRRIRKAQGLTQEAFALQSSRTYVSSLERGLKSPTLQKVDELAQVLNVHPLVLLLLSYMDEEQQEREIVADIEVLKNNVLELIRRPH